MSSSLGSLSPLTSASSFHSSLLSVVGAPPPLAFFPGFFTFGAGGGGPTNRTEKEAESEQGRRTGADSSRASAEKGGVAVARGSAAAAIGGVGRGWGVVLISRCEQDGIIHHISLSYLLVLVTALFPLLLPGTDAGVVAVVVMVKRG